MAEDRFIIEDWSRGVGAAHHLCQRLAVLIELGDDLGQRRDVVLRGQPSPGVTRDEITGIGAIITDNRSAADQRFDEGSGRFRNLLAEDEPMEVLEELQNLITIGDETGKADAITQVHLVGLGTQLGQKRAVAHPGRLEIDAGIHQPLDDIEPVPYWHAARLASANLAEPIL